jgi:hypothetical protein
MDSLAARADEVYVVTTDPLGLRARRCVPAASYGVLKDGRRIASRPRRTTSSHSSTLPALEIPREYSYASRVDGHRHERKTAPPYFLICASLIGGDPRRTADPARACAPGRRSPSVTKPGRLGAATGGRLRADSHRFVARDKFGDDQ